MARHLGVIIEIKIRPDRRHPEKAEDIQLTFDRALGFACQLVGKAINRQQIAFVEKERLHGEMLDHHTGKDPLCIVPDFQHNDKCSCPSPEKFGVLRLFGLDLVVDGYASSNDLMGLYRVNDEMIIEISMVSCNSPVEKPQNLPYIGQIR